MSEQQYAYYIRASSDKQTDQHQVEAIEEWLRRERNVDPDSNSVRRYADFAESGSNNEREDFTRLLSDINAGVIDVLVAWELSRITRDGEMLQKFLNLWEANEVHIYFTNDNISELPPDGDNRFVADVIGAVYQQERRSLIRRVESGIKSALEAGKWLGQVPVGFRRDSEGVSAAGTRRESRRRRNRVLRDPARTRADRARRQLPVSRVEHSERHAPNAVYNR